MNTILKIAISNTTFGYDKLYSYCLINEEPQKNLSGARVLVPFGNGNRKRIGLILEQIDPCESTIPLRKLKPIISIIDEEPLLNAEMVDMIFWLKDNTFCTYFEAFKTIIPSGLNIQFTQKYTLTESIPEDLDTDANALLNSLKIAKSKREFDSLLDVNLNADKKKSIEILLQKGAIAEVDNFKRKIKDDTVKMLRISDNFLLKTATKKLSSRQQVIVDFLSQNETASIKEVCYICNVTPVTISNLRKKDILTEYEYEVITQSDAASYENIDDIILSSQQQQVFNGITNLINNNKPNGALLYGVTGSGKTSVFVKLIDYVLKIGKQAIMLIPEIALTPQMVGKFQSLFGQTVAVIHSNLSLTQRLNEYKRLKTGDAKIAVGTRSAIFAPLDNIGLIIMDEEGERTYKSEASPRYHARDTARKRCTTHNAVMLLASATPSIESFYRAKTGIYQYFELDERYSTAVIPDVSIIDMGLEPPGGSSNIFSQRLIDEICYNLDHKEQVILLLNRRGYHTYISCPDCREPECCPKCSIPLTYHKINGQLICHYCGFTKEFTSCCSKCGCQHMKQTGIGTQKLEDELSQYFPQARILRMDTDTTYSRYAYEKNFKAFGNGDYDIMVGTQMIAKGLDFSNVTLVGVLSIDKALFSGDFRSYERTFSLITQVVGRSGRGNKPGRAFLQTYVPDHYVLNLAANQDYIGFYNEEAALRKALIYPPFCDICIIGFSSLIETEVNAASSIFIQIMSKIAEDNNIKTPMRVLGPSKCVYAKINGKYRYRIIIKCKNTPVFRKYMASVLQSTYKYKEFSNVTTFIDINGEIGL